MWTGAIPPDRPHSRGADRYASTCYGRQGWMSGHTPTVPTARRTSYRKGLATRASIIDAAEQCIFELGFHRATSREVVKRSGVTFGVIQHHFGTYEAVLLSVVERAAARLREGLAAAEISTGTTQERIARVADIVWTYYQQPHYLSYLEIYLNLLRDPATTEATRNEIIKINNDIEALWVDLMVRNLGAAGKSTSLRRLLFGTMRGLAVSRWLHEGRLHFTSEREIFVEAIAAYIDAHGGLGGRAPAKSRRAAKTPLS